MNPMIPIDNTDHALYDLAKLIVASKHRVIRISAPQEGEDTLALRTDELGVDLIKPLL